MKRLEFNALRSIHFAKLNRSATGLLGSGRTSANVTLDMRSVIGLRVVTASTASVIDSTLSHGFLKVFANVLANSDF